MSILKRIGINDVGGPTQVGGNDWDELYDYLNNVSLAGKSAAINTTTSAASGKLGFSGYADIAAISTPANPSSGILRIFADISDGIFKVKKSSGTVVDLEAAGGGGGGDVTGASNVGSGTGQVFRDEVTGVLNLKTLLAGTNVTITNNANDITIAATGGGGGGDVTGAANVGTGTGLLFRDEVAGVLNLKSLLAGSNITITNNANDITLASTGGATSSVQPYTYFIYKDPADSLFKARRGAAGTILTTTSATNVTAVLDAVVADISPPTTPTIIEFGPGDFPMTTVFNNITVPVIGNLTIKGQGMGATNLVPMSAIVGGTVFEVFGATTGSQTNLTANCVAGDRTIAVTSAAGFAAGDTILLRSTAAFSAQTSAQGKKGEIHKIISIATNTITLDKWAHDTYNTVDTANIIKLNTLNNVTFQDLTIRADSAYAGTGTFVSFRYCDNLRVSRIQVVNSRGSGVNFTSCINFNGDVVCEQTPTAVFNSQYGCTVTCASENGKVNVTGIGRWRHLFTIDASGTANLEGQVRNIEVSGTGETNDEATWDTHACGEDIAFRGCNVHGSRNNAAGGDAKGFQMRAKRCSITGCNVWEGVGKGITLGEDASGSLVTGCNIVNTRELDNATLGYGIEIRGSVNNITITGNQIIGSKREGILIRTASGGHVITGNTIQSSGAEGIDATDITNTVVSSNRITSNSKAINMTGTSDNWNIIGNAVSGNTSVSTVTGASNKILGNRGDATLDDGVSATTLDGLTDVTITTPSTNQTLAYNGSQWVNTTATGGGANVQVNSYFVYIHTDGTYKALNAVTGAVDFTHGTSGSDADIGSLLGSIFTTVSSSVPLAIVMGRGDFKVRSWDETQFRRSNFSIVGQGQGLTRFLATSTVTTRVMAFEATPGSTTTTLTANGPKGGHTLDVTSSAGFAVGDDIILCSDEDWDVAFAGADKTQMNRIVAISGNQIFISKSAGEDFNTASNARIIKQPVLRNIYLANFSIENETGNTSQPTYLRLDFCSQLLAENIGIKNVIGDFHKALVTNMVTNSIFTNFLMEYSSASHFTTSGPYGISCRAACENIIFDKFIFIGAFRHAFTTTTNQENVKDGVPKEIYVTNCVSHGCSEASFDTHGEGENLFFINCAAHGYMSADGSGVTSGTADTDAFNLRNKHVYIINPMVTNCRGKGINISASGYGHSIQGGFIRNIRNGMEGIRIESGCHDIQISGINIDTVDKEGIYLMGSNNDVQINDVMITNVGQSATSSGIKVVNSTDIAIRGRIKVGSQKAIELTGTTDWVRIDANCRGSAASTLVGSNNITVGSMGL